MYIHTCHVRSSYYFLHFFWQAGWKALCTAPATNSAHELDHQSMMSHCVWDSIVMHRHCVCLSVCVAQPVPNPIPHYPSGIDTKVELCDGPKWLKFDGRKWLGLMGAGLFVVTLPWSIQITWSNAVTQNWRIMCPHLVSWACRRMSRRTQPSWFSVFACPDWSPAVPSPFLAKAFLRTYVSR